MYVAELPSIPLTDGVLDAQIDAPHEPSSTQQRTAATPVSSSVHAMSAGAFEGHASTVSAKG